MGLQTALADARLVAAAIAAAEASCAREAWDEAIGRLQSVVESRPDLEQLRIELNRIRTEQARLKELAAQQREAAAQVREAERQLRLGDLTGAVAAAERALAIVPQHAEALRLRGEAVTRLEQQARVAIAVSRARNQVARALQHLSAGRFEHAVQEADAALQLVPDFARADAVRTQAARLLEAAAAARDSMAAARRREQEVTRLVSAARTALANGQTGSAMRDAESAIALDPAHHEARFVLDHVRSMVALLAGDDDDTQSIAPAAEARGAGLARFVDQAGEVVSDVRRRLSERLRGRRS
jgi:tetratricopeptide (TPR) repeat protein